MFVIVEEPSDAQALEVLLNQIYDKNSVYLEITHGDVTTTKNAGSSTILSMLGGILETYMKANHLAKSHFQEIVHIVDMDGTYVPDSVIMKDETAHKTIYSLTEHSRICEIHIQILFLSRRLLSGIVVFH